MILFGESIKLTWTKKLRKTIRRICRLYIVYLIYLVEIPNVSICLETSEKNNLGQILRNIHFHYISFWNYFKLHVRDVIHPAVRALNLLTEI